MTASARPNFLMCPPEFFGVSYVINPWMEGQQGHTQAAEVHAQWANLKDLIARKADVSQIAPHAGLPDLVFTANAGLALDGKALLSRFRCPQRQGEEFWWRAWFEKAGFEAILPDLHFEGAGDALFDEARQKIWLGHGFRSDPEMAPIVSKILCRETVPLRLIDPRFYHLDTCFCPLPDGALLYYPAAFDKASQETIAARVPPEQRIAVDEADAIKFCCNAVALDDMLLLNDASPALEERVGAHGLAITRAPLTQFMKAGGAAKCLTLRL